MLATVYFTRYISNSPFPFANIFPRERHVKLFLISLYVDEDILILPASPADSILLTVFIVSSKRSYAKFHFA
jgi:hypothetical protein